MPSLPRVLTAALAAVLVSLCAGPAEATGTAPLGSGGWDCAAGEGDTPPRDPAAWRPCSSLPEAGAVSRLWMRTPLPAGDWRAPSLALRRNSSVRLLSVGGVLLYDTAWSAQRLVPPLLPLPSDAAGSHLEVLLESVSGGSFLFPEGTVGDAPEQRVVLLRRQMPMLVIATLLVLVAVAGLLLALLWRAGRAPGAAFGVYASSSMVVVVLMSGVPTLFGQQASWLRIGVAGAALMGPSVLWLCTTVVLAHVPAWLRLTQRAFWGVGLALAGLELFSPAHVAAIVPFIALLVAGGTAVGVVSAVLEARRGSADARTFLFGPGAALLLTSIDATNIVRHADWAFVSPWGMLAIVAACGLVVVLRARAAQVSLVERDQLLRAEEAAESVLAHELETNAADLLVVVDRLHAAVRAQEDHLSRQAAALQQTHATAEEIRVTSSAAADKARALLESARVAADAGEEGERALERTQAGLAAVAGTVEQMATRVSDVETLSRDMAGIAGTVRELADRTNLLALNASLEASRSGTKGRGFSVVAREVRRLADLSMESADRIRLMLDGVIAGAQSSAEASVRSRSGVEAGSAEVRRSGDELRAVASLIRETNSNVRQIAAAVSQQHAGVSEVFGAVDALTRQAREALDLVGETRAVAESIAGIARSMVEGSALDAAQVAMTDTTTKRAA